MKNEPHVIGDRVPAEHDLIVELKLVSQTQPGARVRFARLRAIFGFIDRRLRERRNRLALLELSDEQLKDIGVSRCQAYGAGFSRYRHGGPDDDEGAEP